jgi:hypothetical protein
MDQSRSSQRLMHSFASFQQNWYTEAERNCSTTFTQNRGKEKSEVNHRSQRRQWLIWDLLRKKRVMSTNVVCVKTPNIERRRTVRLTPSRFVSDPLQREHQEGFFLARRAASQSVNQLCHFLWLRVGNSCNSDEAQRPNQQGSNTVTKCSKWEREQWCGSHEVSARRPAKELLRTYQRRTRTFDNSILWLPSYNVV